jgi:hypothetical protein
MSIPYLAIVIDACNFQSSRERLFYCKGNLAVLRPITQVEQGRIQRIYERYNSKGPPDTPGPLFLVYFEPL